MLHLFSDLTDVLNMEQQLSSKEFQKIERQKLAMRDEKEVWMIFFKLEARSKKNRF